MRRRRAWRCRRPRATDRLADVAPPGATPTTCATPARCWRCWCTTTCAATTCSRRWTARSVWARSRSTPTATARPSGASARRWRSTRTSPPRPRWRRSSPTHCTPHARRSRRRTAVGAPPLPRPPPWPAATSRTARCPLAPCRRRLRRRWGAAAHHPLQAPWPTPPAS